jgi:hypothetical protein
MHPVERCKEDHAHAMFVNPTIAFRNSLKNLKIGGADGSRTHDLRIAKNELGS